MTTGGTPNWIEKPPHAAAISQGITASMFQLNGVPVTTGHAGGGDTLRRCRPERATPVKNMLQRLSSPFRFRNHGQVERGIRDLLLICAFVAMIFKLSILKMDFHHQAQPWTFTVKLKDEISNMNSPVIEINKLNNPHWWITCFDCVFKHEFQASMCNIFQHEFETSFVAMNYSCFLALISPSNLNIGFSMFQPSI